MGQGLQAAVLLQWLQADERFCCRFDVKRVIVGFHGVAAGLAHIHSKGFVDQDLFACNVLQTLDGSAWVKADLGSAEPHEVEGQPNKVYWCM